MPLFWGSDRPHTPESRRPPPLSITKSKTGGPQAVESSANARRVHEIHWTRLIRTPKPLSGEGASRRSTTTPEAPFASSASSRVPQTSGLRASHSCTTGYLVFFLHRLHVNAETRPRLASSRSQRHASVHGCISVATRLQWPQRGITPSTSKGRTTGNLRHPSPE